MTFQCKTMGDLSAHEITEFARQVYPTRHAAWASCTVAILVDYGEGMRQHGTGTLVRIAEHPFLVTASHVVVPPKKEFKMDLFLVGPSGTAPIPLVGSRVVTHSPGGCDDDPADIAVWELQDITISNLGECTFLRQTDIVADDDFAEDYYFFTGFPTVWAKTDDEPDRGLQLLSYCTQLYEGSTTSPTFRPDWHVLLRCGGALQVTGERAEMPKDLRGISGCSIWRSYFTTSGAKGRARVVAVQTGTLKNGTVVQATRWALVVKMISDSYPHLRSAFSLLLPRGDV